MISKKEISVMVGLIDAANKVNDLFEKDSEGGSMLVWFSENEIKERSQKLSAAIRKAEKLLKQ